MTPTSNRAPSFSTSSTSRAFYRKSARKWSTRGIAGQRPGRRSTFPTPAYSPTIAIDNNLASFTDPQTGMVQTDPLATLIPDPNNPSRLVPKGIYIGWTSREVSSSNGNQADFDGPIGIVKVIVSGDGGATFSLRENVSEGNTERLALPGRSSFSLKEHPTIPTIRTPPRIQGGLLGVAFDDFGTAGSNNDRTCKSASPCRMAAIRGGARRDVPRKWGRQPAATMGPVPPSRM